MALEKLQTISEADHAKVRGMAAIVRPLRSFIHKTSDDYRMTGWSDIVVSSEDGTPLEGWYIPAKGGEGNKLIIVNHARPCVAPVFQAIPKRLGVTMMPSRSTLSFSTNI